jgi:hypothetical protein
MRTALAFDDATIGWPAKNAGLYTPLNTICASTPSQGTQMIDQSWDLTGVDALSRERAQDEATRRGLSLAEYLTEIMVQATLVEQESQPAPSPAPSRSDSLELRHRLEALDRRLGVSVGGMEAALHAVDASVTDLGDRLLSAEQSIAEAADDTARALHDLGGALGAMRTRLGEAEDAQASLRAASDRNADALARKLDALATTTNATAGALNLLEQNCADLRHAVAADFRELVADCTDRIESGLTAAREAAAAAQADRAAARLESELAQLRAAFDQGLEDSAANARVLVQAAFDDAADRILALAQGLTDVDRRQARRADQLQASIADSQAANKAAIQQAATGLRQADAELAALVAKTAKEGQAALNTVRDTLADELSEVRQQHASTLNRVEHLAADVADGVRGLNDRQEQCETTLMALKVEMHSALKQAGPSWDARFEAASAHFEARHHMLNANLERVELSTIAALETLSAAMRERDADLEARIAESVAETNALIAGIEARLEAEASRAAQEHIDARTQIAALASASGNLGPRLASLENQLADHIETAKARHDAFIARLAAVAPADDVVRLESRLGKVEASAKDSGGIDALRKRFDALAAQVAALDNNHGLAQRLEELRMRMAPLEAQASETASGMQGVARMLNRLTTQHAEASAQAEKRLAKLEKAIADVHLERLREQDNRDASPLDARLKAFEERHQTALEALRAEIAQFVSENDRRLAAVERGELPGGEDLAAAFDTLRRRMDERVADVEQRSARALEQVADTVTLIERRLLAAGAARG